MKVTGGARSRVRRRDRMAGWGRSAVEEREGGEGGAYDDAVGD